MSVTDLGVKAGGDLWQKIKQQGLSFMLLSAFVVFTQVQRYFDHKEWNARFHSSETERQKCLAFNQGILFKALQANTIVLEQVHEDHEKTNAIMRDYERRY